MANYSTLKSDIQQYIKENHNNEITGAILQSALLAMINSLGVGYQYVGIAIPETAPGTPDQKVFYLATKPGTYVNFNNLVVPQGICVLKYDTEWSLSVLWGVDDEPESDSQNLVKSGGVQRLIYDNFARGEKTLSSVDLDVVDKFGAIIMRIVNGGIITKNFNSADIISRMVTSEATGKDVIDFCDPNGYVGLRFPVGFDISNLPRQKMVIVDVNGNGKYTSITEASAKEPENTVFLIMPGIYDDENVQGCDIKKQHFIGLARESTIVKNHQNGNNNCVFTIGAGTLANLTIIKEYSESAIVEPNSYAVHADSNTLYNDTLLIDNCYIMADRWACAMGLGMKGGCHIVCKNTYFKATNTISPAAYGHDNDLNGYDGIQTWTMIDCVFYAPNCGEAIGFQSQGKDGRNSIYNIEMIRTRLKSTNSTTPYWIRNFYPVTPGPDDFLGLVNGRLIETSWGNSCNDFNNI